MKLLALGVVAGAIALLIAGLSLIIKGRVGMGIVLGVVALIIGSSAGAMAAYV